MTSKLKLILAQASLLALVICLGNGFAEAATQKKEMLKCTLILLQPMNIPGGETFYSIVPETKTVTLRMKIDVSKKTPYGFYIDTIVNDPEFPQYQIVKTKDAKRATFFVTMGATSEYEGEVSLPGISMGSFSKKTSGFSGGWRFIGTNFGMDAYVDLPKGESGHVVMTCLAR